MLPFPAVPPAVLIEAVGRQKVQPGWEVIVVAVLGDPAIIVTLPFCPGVSPPVVILKTVLPPNPGSVMVPPDTPLASATKLMSPPLPKKLVESCESIFLTLDREMFPPVADAPGAMTMSYVGLIEKSAPAMKFIAPAFTGVPLKVVGTVSMLISDSD